jgi:anaerobic selenocysteine-containing dehydrogenase
MSEGITRRNFVKLGAIATVSVVLAGCQSPRRSVTLEPYVIPPEEQLAGTATWYASTCRQCPAGCGIVVRVMNGRAKKIEGNAEHPLNRGKLCARGQAGLQLLYNPDRLQGPVQQAQRGSRQFQLTQWNEGINTLSAKVQSAGSAVAVWGDSTMSGHLYDLFARFTQAIGASQPVLFDLYTAFHGYQLLSTTSRDLFGANELPTYDLGRADVVFSFGADFASTGLSAVRYGAAYGQFRGQALGKRGYFVQFEPKMTITGAKADRWLPVKPGTEGLVAQAIARLIADRGFGSNARVTRARAVAGTVDVNGAAAAGDISVDELARLARIFAEVERPLAIPGHALTGMPNGAEAVKAVQALNFIAGNFNQPGGMALSSSSQRSAPAKRNLSSFTDAQKLIRQMQDGSVKVLMIHGANPAYDLPPKLGFIEALQKVPFVVSFAPLVDETALWADLILPDRTYLEAWGYDVVSPSFDTPIVSSQQPVVVPAYDSRATADILLTVAQRVPAAAKVLAWKDEVAFLKESVARLGAGAAGGAGSGVLWSRFLQHGGWWPVAAPGASPAQTAAPAPLQVSPAQFQGHEKEYPFYLHIFMNDLLSDGRGASQPWLQGSPDGMTTMSWQTWVEINPATAQQLGVQDGDMVKVTSPHGEVEALVYTFPAIRPDTVALPLGLGHTDLGRYAMDRGSNPMTLVGTTPDATGNSLTWAALRVKISRTNKKADLATFEFKAGVTDGFINQTFPGG